MTSFIFDDVIYRTACILVAREFFVSAGDLVSVFANLSQNVPYHFSSLRLHRDLNSDHQIQFRVSIGNYYR